MKILVVCLSVLSSPLQALSQTVGAPDTHFTIVLSRTQNPPGIVAQLMTTSTYPCAGYRIQTRVTYDTDTVTIHIGGMVRPTGCLSTFDTAKGSEYLGNPRRETMFLRITYRGSRDLYALRLGQQRNRIVSQQNTFTELQEQVGNE